MDDMKAAMMGGGNDEDDEDLEAELLALTQGEESPKKQSPKKKNTGVNPNFVIDVI